MHVLQEQRFSLIQHAKQIQLLQTSQLQQVLRGGP